MTQSTNRRFELVLLLVVASSAPASAQTASSFEQLALLVDTGDRITVTDDTGRKRTGRIVDLSPSAIALAAEGARYDFRETHVDTISQVRQDSLKNGAGLGFTVGVAVGATYFVPRYDLAGGSALMFVGLWAGAGASVGVVLDALTPSRQLIYRSTDTSRRVTVAPLVASTGRGVAVSLGF